MYSVTFSLLLSHVCAFRVSSDPNNKNTLPKGTHGLTVAVMDRQ